MRRCRSGHAPEFRRELVWRQHRSVFGAGDDALHFVAELADVARPVADHQKVNGLRRNLYVAATELRGVMIDVVVDDGRNLRAPLAQGWHAQANHVQAIVKVFAETPLRDHLFKVCVSCGDDPHVNLRGALLAERLNLAFL